MRIPLLYLLFLPLMFVSLPASSSDAGEGVSNYQQGINKLVSSFNNREAGIFVETLDMKALLDKSLNKPYLDGGFSKKFRDRFMQKGAQSIASKLITQLGDSGLVKLVRLKKTDTGARALIRMDFGEEGYGYLDLHLLRDEQGKTRIVDWFDYSSGRLYSQSLYHLVAMLAPTPTLVGKVFDLATNKKERSNEVLRLLKLSQQGKHREMTEAFLKSEADLRRNRMLNFFAIQSAGQTGDEKLYLQAMKNMAEYYGDDANVQLILLDYYYLTANYPRAIEALNRVEESFGAQDAAIQYLKANTHIQTGHYKEAIDSSRLALKIEPEFENAHWSLLLAYVNSKDYAQAVEIAEILQNRFQYDMGPESLKQAEVYDDLLASKAYKRWQKGL